jgi:hypothetical protein
MTPTHTIAARAIAQADRRDQAGLLEAAEARGFERRGLLVLRLLLFLCFAMRTCHGWSLLIWTDNAVLHLLSIVSGNRDHARDVRLTIVSVRR